MKKNKYKTSQLVSLDLHAYVVEEVFDAVEEFINKANERQLARVRIIHGKGTGKVKAEVIRYLNLAKYQFQAERLDNGQINEGALIVFVS